MPEKLYLIDGMSNIYRAYYAIRGLTSKQGLPTNAVYGFTTMLRKLVKEEQPDYLGVAMDVSGPTVRHEKFVDYKATRKPMPEDLAQQMPYVLQVCEVLRIPVLTHPRYEADDVIGTLAEKAAARGLQVVIVTIDKDMFQLVNERISVLDTRTMTRLNRKKVEEKMGVPPERVVDVLSLVGDTSDNIPGAPGIGEKGAQQLIQQFGSLEELLARRDEVSRKTYRESLQQHQEQIFQSRDLLAVHRDLPVDLDLEALRCGEPDYEKARELFYELEFTSLVEEFVPPPETGQTSYQTLESSQQLTALIETLKGKQASLALIYPPEDYLDGELSAISVCAEKFQSSLIPFRTLSRFPQLTAQLLRAPESWIIHDLKPFYFFAERLQWPVDAVFHDTMLAAYLLSPNQNNFSLPKLALEHLRCKMSENGEGDPQLFDPAHALSWCERADMTFRLHECLWPQIDSLGLDELMEKIEIPLSRVLARMESHGVKVDGQLLTKMSGEMDEEIAALTDRIYALAGTEFNLNSPRQLAEVLFEKMGLPIAKKTRKAGHYATGVEVLEELASDFEVAQLILDYRELSKLKNTYLDALPKLVNPRTGRIHTSYNQMVAATGRLSSSNPNLQNIPIKSELGRQIRRAFIAEEGHILVTADYSQIELRVMAHLSEDPVLMDAFQKGEDIHDRTAREVFGMNAVMNPQEFRRHAKVINFGIMYGLSAFGLAQSLKIERREAQQFIDDYFARYQGVQKWIYETLEEVRNRGFVTTLFGRIRPIPEIHSRNWNLRNFGERTAINAPIQGTAADLIKIAMIEIDREMQSRGLSSKLILQVHDELVFEVAEREKEEMEDLVRSKMESAADLRVPLKVDMGSGKSWYSAK